MSLWRARSYLTDKHGEGRVAAHPLLTPAMICIDGLAAVVRGELAPVHVGSEECDMSGESVCG
jgi:hypothetical protein